MIDHGALAKEYFLKGYNCSQAVLLAFSDLTRLDEKTAMMMASSFGGGMGRMREVCGAVSGAFMVLGALFGYAEHEDKAKSELYSMVRDFADRFRNENGSIVCRELLAQAGVPKDTSHEPEKRTPEYYKKRPCREYVEIAARILDEMIDEKGSLK